MATEFLTYGTFTSRKSSANLRRMEKYAHRRERLQELLDSRFMGVAARLVEASGISASYLSRMLSPINSPGHKRMGEDMTDKIEKSLNLPRGWFDLSKSTDLSDNYAIKVLTKVNAELSDGPAIKGKVPLISWVRAGRFDGVNDLLRPGDAVDWIDTTAPVGRATFALRVEGDSMEPDFPAGTILIVEPAMDPLPGDFVVAKQDGQATFKQLTKDGPELYLKPLNARYPIKPLGQSEIVGIVRASERRFR